MQDLTRPPREPARPEGRFDQVNFVLLGNGRKAHHLPLLLLQHMADQIVLVQALHESG